MQTDTTRRQILALGTSAAAYAAGAAIVAGGVALASEAKSETTDTTAWRRAFAAWEQAKATYERESDNYNRAYAAYCEVRPDMAKLDVHRFPRWPSTRREIAYGMDLDELEKWWREGEGKFWWGNGQRELDAIDRVRAFRAADRAAQDRFNVEHHVEAEDAAGDALNVAEGLLMRTPAPNVAALRWKLDHIFREVEEGGSMEPYTLDYVTQTMADYRRLLGGEA